MPKRGNDNAQVSKEEYDDEAEEVVGDDGRPLGTSGFARADAGQLQKRRIIKAGRRFRQAQPTNGDANGGATPAPVARAAAAPGGNPFDGIALTAKAPAPTPAADARIRRRFKELRKQGVPTKEAMIRASLSKVNEQLASTKLSDQDEAKPPADTAVGDTDTMEDPELWKPHPPTEECPVCMVPLAFEHVQTSYWTCCGKYVCKACSEEHRRALKVTNRKREKKKQPPLEKTCAFCRRPVQKNDSELISRYEERVDKGDTVAMLNLAGKYLKGSNGVRKNDDKALELLQMAADLGSVVAIQKLGCWASDERLRLIPSGTSSKEYFEDGAKKGNVLSRYYLAERLAEDGSIDLAIRHWHLAAAAGHGGSMKRLWKCFNRGKLSKPNLEKALRAHKEASDEMNSEDRKRYAAYKEALDGTDELVKTIYDSYYDGYINAKELKKALKAHAAGDRRAVKTFLLNKIRTNR